MGFTSPPSDGWLLVGQRRVGGGWECEWAHDAGRTEDAQRLHAAWVAAEGKHARLAARESLIMAFPPTRWLRTHGRSGIEVTTSDRPVTIYLPATLRAVVEVTERGSKDVYPQRAPDGEKHRWERTSSHEVTIQVVRDLVDGRPRAAINSVTVSRSGSTPVSAGVLRYLCLGDLVDWMLTREPVVATARVGGQHVGRYVVGGELVSGYLGPKHPAAKEVLRTVQRRTGKRIGPKVTPEQIAQVARAATPRHQGQALADAFPQTSRRTLYKLLAQAREMGLVDHSPRSAATPASRS